MRSAFKEFWGLWAHGQKLRGLVHQGACLLRCWLSSLLVLPTCRLWSSHHFYVQAALKLPDHHASRTHQPPLWIQTPWWLDKVIFVWELVWSHLSSGKSGCFWCKNWTFHERHGYWSACMKISIYWGKWCANLNIFSCLNPRNQLFKGEVWVNLSVAIVKDVLLHILLKILVCC